MKCKIRLLLSQLGCWGCSLGSAELGKKKNHNTVVYGGHLTHKAETYKTKAAGEKTTK